MATGTISRDSTSVTFQLWEEGGQLLVARDLGKPNARVSEVARSDPRTSDHLSSLDNFTVIGRLNGDSAYGDANTLATLIKSHSGGSDLSLDLSSVTGLSTYTVGVTRGNALRLDYRPGTKDIVDVRLSLPVVNTTIG